MKKIPYERLQEIAEVVIPKVIQNIIIDTEDGYVLYNLYRITKKKNYFSVYRRTDEKEYIFFSLKNAVTWVILDKHFYLFEAMRVHELDNLLFGLMLEKKIHEKIKKKSKDERYWIQQTKLENLNYKQNSFKHELDKYIIVAKDCQHKGFKYEINRAKRK